MVINISHELFYADSNTTMFASYESNKDPEMSRGLSRYLFLSDDMHKEVSKRILLVGLCLRDWIMTFVTR